MIDVGGDHVSRAVVAFAVERRPQAKQLRPRPTHRILSVVIHGHLFRQAQFFLERILANPQLREPVVQDRQVGRFDVHGQRRDRGVDLVDLAFETFGIAGPMIDRRRRTESLDGFVDAVAIGGDDAVEVAQHPIFQRLGSNSRGHLADRATMPASARADVVVGDHVGPARLASLATWIAPELVTAVTAFDHAGQ